MAISWPSNLPELPEAEGFSEAPDSGVIRTEMDTGPAKTRRRFTATTCGIKVKYAVTQTQSLIFDSFHKTTLYGGALSFLWTNPRSGLEITVRIKGYSYSNNDTQRYLNLDLEQLP